MQAKSTPKSPENASVYDRRVPAILEAPGVDADLDQLNMLIDAREEVEARHCAALDAVEELEDDPAMPAEGGPRADLLTLLGENEAHMARYYPRTANPTFRGDDVLVQIHNFFEAQLVAAHTRAASDPANFSDWPAVKAADHVRAIKRVEAQRDRTEQWFIKSGYRSAVETRDRLTDEAMDLERQISAFPVTSFKMMRRKLEFVECWGDVLDDDRLRAVINSFRDFADTDGRPGRRQDRAAEAGAA